MYLKKPLDVHTLNRLTISLNHTPYCDFCGDDCPQFVYGSTRMSDGVFMKCWRWCACWGCAEAIDGAEWEELLAKLIIKTRKILPNVPTFQIKSVVERELQEFKNYVMSEVG